MEDAGAPQKIARYRRIGDWRHLILDEACSSKGELKIAYRVHPRQNRQTMWYPSELGCSHASYDVLKTSVVFTIKRHWESKGLVDVRTDGFLGMRGVSFSFNPERKPEKRCAHLLFSLGVPKELFTEDGKLAERSDEWIAKTQTVAFLVDSVAAIDVESFAVCSECLSAGCPKCDGLGWIPELLGDAFFGPPGAQNCGTQHQQWNALRKDLPASWRYLGEALAAQG